MGSSSDCAFRLNEELRPAAEVGAPRDRRLDESVFVGGLQPWNESP